MRHRHPSNRPQAVYLPATTKATRWVWDRDNVNDDDDDNKDGREWTHRPNTIGAEAPLFLGATNTGCVREAASATVAMHAPPDFQKRKKLAKHAPPVQITDGLRRYHVNQELARAETVDSAMLGKDHTGNDRSHRTTYPQNHRTDQHPHDLDPIQDSSSSETSSPYRADGRAYLARDLYTHARDVMATTTDPSITTNEISVSDPKPSHTGPDPSGAKLERKKELPGERYHSGSAHGAGDIANRCANRSRRRQNLISEVRSTGTRGRKTQSYHRGDLFCTDDGIESRHPTEVVR